MQATKIRYSKVWKCFTIIDKTNARCNYCQEIFNCTSVSNLNRHAKKKHPEKIQLFKKQNETMVNQHFQHEQQYPNTEASMLLSANPSSLCGIGLVDKSMHPLKQEEKEEDNSLIWPITSETSSETLRVVEFLLETDGAKCDQKTAFERSYIWKHFTKIDDTFSKCNHCEIKLSCKYSFTDLIMHMKIEHPTKELKSGENETKKEGNVTSFSEGSFDADSADDKLRATRQSKKTERRTSVGKFFKVFDNSIQCRICHVMLPRQAATTNFICHMTSEHPSKIKSKKDTDMDIDDEPDSGTDLMKLNQSKISGFEEDSTTGTTIVNIQKGKRRISCAWQYFTSIDKNYAQCKICSELISHKSTSSNMMKHVRRKHKPYLITNDHAQQMNIGDIKPSQEDNNQVPDLSNAETSCSPIIHSLCRQIKSTSPNS